MRNGQNGRRRGRGGAPRAPGGGPRPDMGNRNEVRVRGNAHQLLEKYKQLARDASMQGDRVTAEYYMQYADHYYRVLNEFRARQEEQQAQRQQYNQRYRDDRDDYEDDRDEIEGAEPIRVSEMTRTIPEPQADAAPMNGADHVEDGESEQPRVEAAQADAEATEEEAPRRRGRGRPRRPRREASDEGTAELAPVEA